jgi:hypothetical protein
MDVINGTNAVVLLISKHCSMLGYIVLKVRSERVLISCVRISVSCR